MKDFPSGSMETPKAPEVSLEQEVASERAKLEANLTRTEDLIDQVYAAIPTEERVKKIDKRLLAKIEGDLKGWKAWIRPFDGIVRDLLFSGGAAAAGHYLYDLGAAEMAGVGAAMLILGSTAEEILRRIANKEMVLEELKRRLEEQEE